MPRFRSSIGVLIGVLALPCIWFLYSRVHRGPEPYGLAVDAANEAERAEPDEHRLDTTLDLADATDRSIEPATGGVGEPSAEFASAAARVTVRLHIVESGSELPIHGARVTTFEDSTPGVHETGLDGMCTFEVPADGDRMLLLVEREGYFHLRYRPQRSERLEISLYPCAALYGRVLDVRTGSSVPGTSITLSPPRCEGCKETVVSCPDGEYEFPCVPLRSGTVTFWLEAYAYPRQVRQFEIRSDEPRVEQDFRIERGTEVSGRVVDFETGAPLSGARAAELVTDSNGLFDGYVVVDHGERTVGFRVEASGHCRLEADVPREQLSQPLLFRLPRGTAIEGFVHDIEGRTIRGASVWITDPSERESSTFEGWGPDTARLAELPEHWSLEPEDIAGSPAMTDEAGHFRIENAVPWSQLVPLGADADGFEFAELLVERAGAPGETTRVDFVLVRKEPGQHLVARICLNGRELGQCRGRVQWWGESESGEAELGSGQFDLSVAPGEYLFRVEVDGLPESLVGTEFRLKIAPGQELKHRVELSMPVETIRGRITLADGRPAIRVRVSASCPFCGEGEFPQERIEIGGATTTDGDYALEVPAWDRPYRVAVEDHHDWSFVNGIRAGASSVDLVLSVPGRALIRIVEVGARTRPSIFQLGMQWRRRGEEQFHNWNLTSNVVDAEGWIEEWLPSGQLDLRAEYWKPGFRPAMVEDVWIPPDGKPANVEFVLEKE